MHWTSELQWPKSHRKCPFRDFKCIKVQHLIRRFGDCLNCSCEFLNKVFCLNKKSCRGSKSLCAFYILFISFHCTYRPGNQIYSRRHRNIYSFSPATLLAEKQLLSVGSARFCEHLVQCQWPPVTTWPKVSERKIPFNMHEKDINSYPFGRSFLKNSERATNHYH